MAATTSFLKNVQNKYAVVALTSRPSVYVGTYGKYNSGSLNGKWMYLDDYADYDEFLEAAQKLHSDEADPELMFQDFEGFPERYYRESSLDKNLWDWLDLSEDDRELLEVYIQDVGDAKATIEQARDAFQGVYKSEEDWAAQFIDDVGLSDDVAASYLMISDLDAQLLAQDLVEDSESDEVDEVERSLKRDPVGYLVDETGLYTVKDLIKSDFMQIDYKAYARESDMSFVHRNGEVWVFNNN